MKRHMRWNRGRYQVERLWCSSGNAESFTHLSDSCKLYRHKEEGEAMNDINTLTTFFGWCTIINIVFLVGLLIRGLLLRNFAANFFGVTTEEMKLAYMRVFLQYRNATLLLSLTPYVALKIMGWG